MKHPDIQLITCGIENIGDICALAKQFIEESEWKFTYDDAICRIQLFDCIASQKADVIAAYANGKIAGATIVQADHDLTAELLGFVSKFYVSPEFRRTLVARKLVKAQIEWFDRRGCVMSFTTSTGHVGEGSICAYTNLMSKYGYDLCGPALSRRQGKAHE